ncbi:cytochrome P450 [Polaromonas sp.]|uniref:cytochrome P450 n=1 Tax=Polaromonas sp. TaxID=1869339 RepID=UPI003267E1D2
MTTQYEHFDPTAPDVIDNPFPMFSRLRESDPAHWSERLGGWVLTRYWDVRESLNWSVERLDAFLQAVDHSDSKGMQRIALWATFNDAPMHVHLRRLMAKALSSDFIDTAEPIIHDLSKRLSKAAKERDQIDFMADFAHQIPIGVMAKLFNLPDEDIAMLRHWVHEINLFVGAAKHVPDKYPRSSDALESITEYFMRHYEQRVRKSGGNDLLSRLIFAEEDGDRMTRDEVVATCVMLLYAGHITTTHMLGNALHALLKHPDQLRDLQKDPSIAQPACEELLRYDGPVQSMVRVAINDTLLHDRTIKAGDRIFPMLNAANRDPRRFDNPDKLDIHRERNSHIVFGHGPHTCIGLRLARLELPIAINSFLADISHVEAAGSVSWIDSVAFRGPDKLPVHLVARN